MISRRLLFGRHSFLSERDHLPFRQRRTILGAGCFTHHATGLVLSEIFDGSTRRSSSFGSFNPSIPSLFLSCFPFRPGYLFPHPAKRKQALLASNLPRDSRCCLAGSVATRRSFLSPPAGQPRPRQTQTQGCATALPPKSSTPTQTPSRRPTPRATSSLQASACTPPPRSSSSSDCASPRPRKRPSPLRLP